MNTNRTDLICFSHLRWGFVFQRPQHLMSRFAQNRRVFYFEEPVFEDDAGRSTRAGLRHSICGKSGVNIYTPVLPFGLTREQTVQLERESFESLLIEQGISDYVAWYYTPMAREFSNHLHPSAVIYDCMDELSAFAGAPPEMRSNEQELFASADVVFTGGASLYQAKRRQHHAVHQFPSSVDGAHFAQARHVNAQPEDQAAIPYPRLGYAGVIDERMDLCLLARMAVTRPDWHFVLIGPVVKIDPVSLPQYPNIHYLGMKQYSELPAYFAGWEIGILPFALNESTRYISPTKTPEYLAAGLRVISTAIADVVTPYGDLELVGIANSPGDFVRIAESMLTNPWSSASRERVDAFLSKSSWDKTWSAMDGLINETLLAKSSSKGRTSRHVTVTSPAAEGVAHV